MFLSNFFVGVFNFFRFIKNRERDFLAYEKIPQMEIGEWSLFCNQQVYGLNDSIEIFIRNRKSENTLVVQRIIAPYEYETVYTENFISQIFQPINTSDAEKGCDWELSVKIKPGSISHPGYYRVFLENGTGAPFTFIVSDYDKKSDIAILAPCTTWVAYNPWGGKSLYKNGINKNNVYRVSTLRPNSALEYKKLDNLHDVNIEANIYNSLSKDYSCTIYPDYVLEKDPHQLLNHKVIILAYHAEYISEAMYRSLRHLVNQKKKSFINLGANQIYWKVKWHNNFTSLECRKNNTFFDDTYQFGGLWKNSNHPEKKLLGVSFNDDGMGTFAPYQVKNANHWLFEGTNVKNGDLFGQTGINELGICGDETDKPLPSSECIAIGLNPKEEGFLDNYPLTKYNWDSQGGGGLCFKALSDHHGVLSTGSIQSGSGLGSDKVFTQIVKNFIERYI